MFIISCVLFGSAAYVTVGLFTPWSLTNIRNNAMEFKTEAEAKAVAEFYFSGYLMEIQKIEG